MRDSSAIVTDKPFSSGNQLFWLVVPENWGNALPLIWSSMALRSLHWSEKAAVPVL